METKRLYTLAEAAEATGVSVHVLRKRADRGTLTTIKRDGVRHVARAELDRVGLLPDAELRELRRENARLREEISEHRRITVSAQSEAAAEREGRERVANALAEQHALAQQANARAQAAEARAKELGDLERELEVAGPIRAWKLARTLRHARRQAEIKGLPEPASAA